MIDYTSPSTDFWSSVVVTVGSAGLVLGSLVWVTSVITRRRLEWQLRRYEELRQQFEAQQERTKFVPEAPADLAGKVRTVQTLSDLLSRLNLEIRSEFEVQLAEVERLQQKADDAKAIASLNDKALKAAETLIASQMDRALKQNSRTDRVFQILLAMGGAVVGIIATLLIQALTGS